MADVCVPLQLARLIAGAGTATNKPKPNTPAERLSQCTRICNSLRNLWQRGNIGPEDDAASRRAVELLERLNDLLTDESRRAAPHSCLQHISVNQSYIIVVKIALESQHPDVISHTASFFHILINGEIEGLLDNKLFSRSLLDLVRYTVTVPQVFVDERTENELVELLFEIATKIRLDPDILPAWFHPERDRSQQRLVSEARKSQFPLFFVLVQYVHNDGQAGDFARTGLLYLTETASRSKQLETWMIESDLAPQMASGLGALYSRLSRQFPPLGVNEKTIPILALSDAGDPEAYSTETRESFTQNMTEFLTYLAFWQDTINRCKSPDVADTLLDHFQVLFVQQLLYPSLLESSDVMGGSTAAVIAHLARILLALEDQKLAQRMLRYLLASKDARQEPTAANPRTRFSKSRRQSLDTLAALAEAAQSPSPDLFNLLDLINMSLKSRHANTVNACPKLVSVILTRHHPSALSALFKTQMPVESSLGTGMEIFNKRLMDILELAGDISLDQDTLDESYQGALADAKFRLEAHSCSITETSDGQAILKRPATISPDFKLLGALLAKLEMFFLNDPLTNLGLSQCLMDIAACENISVYGWLMPPSSSSHPAVYSVIEKLVQQVKQWRGFFPEWDFLIAQRRADLRQEEPEHPKRPGYDLPVPSPTKAAFATSTLQQSTPPRSIQGSRPVTPTTATRGRAAVSTPTFGSIDNTLSASPTPKARTPLAERPAPGSPLRQSYLSQSMSTTDNARSTSRSTASRTDEPAADLTDDATEALLKTMITLDLESGNMPEESSPLLPMHAGKARPGTDTPISTSELLNIPDGQAGSGAVTPTPSAIESQNPENKREVSLSHVLTSAVILQEFILEIAATVQVRATMLNEVDIS